MKKQFRLAGLVLMLVSAELYLLERLAFVQAHARTIAEACVFAVGALCIWQCKTLASFAKSLMTEKFDDTPIARRSRRDVSRHEAGHVVVTHIVAKLRLKSAWIRRTDPRGYSGMASYHFDSLYATRAQLIDRIAICMAGPAAEELLCEGPCTGSEQDLRDATETACDIVARHGMGDATGKMHVDLRRDKMSESLRERIENEVRAIVDEQYARAKLAIEAHLPLVEHVAAALEKSGHLNARELQSLLAQPSAPTVTDGEPATT